MIERRWLRLLVAYHVWLCFRWYVDSLIRYSYGDFWATNKLWLTFVYADNPAVWEGLVWDDLLHPEDRPSRFWGSPSWIRGK